MYCDIQRPVQETLHLTLSFQTSVRRRNTHLESPSYGDSLTSVVLTHLPLPVDVTSPLRSDTTGVLLKTSTLLRV